LATCTTRCLTSSTLRSQRFDGAGMVLAMPAPYRKASRYALLWIAIIFAGIGVSLFIASQVDGERFGAWMLLIFSGPIVLSMVVAVIINNRLDKKRIEGLRQLFERKGITMDSDPDAAQRNQFYQPISFLTEWMGLESGAANIQWLAASNRFGVFEHMFHTGSGKHVQEHLETVVVVPSPYRTEGGLTARKAGFSMKRAWRDTESKFEIGVPEFDKNWVLSGNPIIAEWFLIPQVREILADSPHGESWVLGNNYLCLSFDGTLQPNSMEVVLDRVKRIAETIEKFVPFEAAKVAAQ
jgi:hypothetical protein